MDSYGYERVSTGFVPLYDLGLKIREANKNTQYQVRQIFEFSCSLLDNAVNDSSKNMLLKRSPSNKKPSLAKKGKTTNTPAVHRCHPPFFHVDDEELQRRMKRSNAIEASKSST